LRPKSANTILTAEFYRPSQLTKPERREIQFVQMLFKFVMASTKIM
jgi:hypothetical protein